MEYKKDDMEIRKALQSELEIPKAVEKEMEGAYEQIRTGQVRMKRLGGWKKKRSRNLGIAAAAACLVVVVSGTFYVNPALAKDIPILGDVFGKIQQMRESSPYPDKDKTAYDKIAEHSEKVKDITNTAEGDGASMEITDAYCDGYDLYFTMTVKVEDEEMKTADTLDLVLAAAEDLSTPAIAYINGQEAYPSTSMTLEKAEDGVYTGLVRIPAWNLPDEKFPESMVVSTKIDAVAAHKTGEIITADNEWYGFKSLKGSWEMQFETTVDTSHNQTVQLQAENNGFSVTEMTKTPSNTYLTLHLTNEWGEKNPAVVLTDVAGNRIGTEGAKIVQEADGSWTQYLVFDQTEAEQFNLKIIDKNAEAGEDGMPPVAAEFSISMQ